VLFDVLFCDKANASLPGWRWIVQNVVDLEPVQSMSFLQCLKICLEKDIVRIHVSIKQGNLGSISRIPEASTNDLDHGSNSGTASNHCDMLNEIRCVQEVSLRPFDADRLARFEKRNVFRYVSFFIRLDGYVSGADEQKTWRTDLYDEFKVAAVIF
jgi:hypothetical protein